MTFYYIIAGSKDDYTDYLNKFKIPECDATFICDGFSFNSSRFKSVNQHHLHITKFASRIEQLKIKFIDIQIELTKNSFYIKTFIEKEDGWVCCSNVSFLRNK